MKTMSFQYTKENGEVSNRVFRPFAYPGTNYFGVDITELDIEDQVAFDEAMTLIEDEKAEKVKALMAMMDIKNNFRSFKAERMSNIVQD